MTRTRAFRLAVAWLACLSVGASCGHGQGPGETPVANHGERIDHLSAVDTTDMTPAEQRLWVDIVNDVLSPCGEPVTLAHCANDAQSRCHPCVPAARYLARLVTDGYDRGDIEDRFHARYARDTRVNPHVEGAPVRGPPMARLTIVEFSDYECPYCGAAEPILADAMRQYEGRVKLVFMNYPLDQHPRAMPAARAAVAAANQGKFWEMHDLLFSHQEALEDDDFDRYAVQLGLDVERFRHDMAAPETQQKIDADKAEGHRLQLTGTPTMFIANRRFRDSPQSLAAYLREELEQ